MTMNRIRFGSPLSVRRLAFAVVAATSGCAIVDPGGSVETRIENASAVTIDRVVVYPGGRDSLVATNLAVGERTRYLAVERAYRLVTVEARIGADIVRQQVIDYVGETPLGSGRYTYRVRVIPRTGNPGLEVELVED